MFRPDDMTFISVQKPQPCQALPFHLLVGFARRALISSKRYRAVIHISGLQGQRQSNNVVPKAPAGLQCSHRRNTHSILLRTTNFPAVTFISALQEQSDDIFFKAPLDSLMVPIGGSVLSYLSSNPDEKITPALSLALHHPSHILIFSSTYA